MTTDDAWAPPPRPSTPAPDVPAGAASAPVPRVDGYVDLAEVARGGDSIVYRAREEGIDRAVAIKVIAVADDASRARFARELEITVRLGRQHPHVVTVLATTTTHDGSPCLVMDFHDLGSLHDRVRATGPLAVSEVVAAGTAAADALAFAHAQGVLHRDVKPQNILLLPTSYVLTDFGIARLADAGHTGTLDRFSYRHASPQVLDGAPPTAADDVWSLGSTLFTLLEGRAPFASDDADQDTALAYLRRVRTGARRPVTRTDAPAELIGVIEDCLTPDREQRTVTAAQVRDRLRAARTEDRSWQPAEPGPAPSEHAPAPVAHAPGTGTDADRDTDTPTPSAPAPSSGAAASGWEDAGRATPSVVAPSALAHLSAAPADSEEHTSLRPAGSHAGSPADPSAHPSAGAPRQTPPASDQTTPRPRRLARVLSFVLGALVVGAIVGVGTALLSRDRTPQDTPVATTSPPAVEVPTTDGPLPDQDEDLQALTSNPELEPQQVVAVDDGTSILLTWHDPSGGETATIVVDPSVDPPRALSHIPAGTTRFRLEGVDPDAAEVCVVLVAWRLSDDDVGLSETTCVTR
ncbi:MAG: protein kinase domain-containing protein [Cellulomonadaceae bacterium]